jgi:GTP pyrophosphokinase
MRRYSGDPYIYHPLEVAIICSEEIGLGTTSIVSALLHDVVEDTDYTLDDIRNHFGDKIASIVDGLTKITDFIELSKSDDTSIQAENYRKILITMADDVRVILIKLADRLHNMRTLNSLPPHKQQRIAAETSVIFAPLAHRLGLYNIKSELEDLALKYNDPEIYNYIKYKIEETSSERDAFIKDFIKPIKERLDQTNLKYKITWRTKAISSIYRKMTEKQLNFEEIYDVFAIRIILDSPPENEKSDCWLVYSIITDIYTMNPERLRDWISVPKANGYESLHVTLMSKSGKWVEVQIRSKRMDEIAEKGYAAHWKYKENNGKISTLDEWLNSIRNILENPNENALDFLDDVKFALFTDEIPVFTPKGKLLQLPKGSTVLDFAYAIHTDLGDHCISAKVNHKTVPVNTVLKSGDQVNILTSEKSSPNPEWLNFVKTSKARNAIKAALRKQELALAEHGKEIIERMFTQLKEKYNDNLLQKFANYLGYNNIKQLYIAAAKGQFDVKQLKQFLQSQKPSTFSRLFRHYSNSNKNSYQSNEIEEKEKIQTKIILDTTQQINYILSECCSPIMGDQLIGYISDPHTLEIHRTTCPVFKEKAAVHGDRVTKVKWEENRPLEFKTSIELEGSDRKGIVKDISKLISEEMNSNIRYFFLEVTEGTFKGEIKLYVNNIDHLKQLIDKIKTIDGVSKVYRKE